MAPTPHSESDKELERAKREATQLASEAAETARRRGRQAMDRAKGEAADRAEEFATALETSADDLESSETGEMLSGYGRSMAELMRRFAGGLRENEIEDFAGQLAGFARRNPASFLAGSVAIGFGVSRFLKATSTRSLEQYGYEDEYLLDEEDDFEFEDSAATASPRPDYGASSHSGYGSSSDYDVSSRSDYTSGAPYGASSSSEHSSSPSSADITAADGTAEKDSSGKSLDEARSDDLRRNEP